MGALTGQTIAASYEQLLQVDRSGGGNGSNLVDVKDGDNGTTFCIKLNDSSTAESIFHVFGSHANGTTIEIDNTAGDGDVGIKFQLSGTTEATMGIDDSNDDIFEINSGDALGSTGAIMRAYTDSAGGHEALFAGGINYNPLSGGGPLQAKSNSSHKAITIFENSGDESFDIGVVADGSLAIMDSGTQVFTIKDVSNGWVGIGAGATSPICNVDIREDTSGGLNFTNVNFKLNVLLNADDASNAIGWVGTATDMWFCGAGGDALYWGYKADDDFTSWSAGPNYEAKILNSNGDFYTNDGTVHSLSDSRVKKDVTTLTDGLAIVNQLRPVTFKYNGKQEMNPGDTRLKHGFIADEVLSVASQYVDIGNDRIDGVEVDDFKTMVYTKFIPMMVKAIQELSAKVTALENA